MINQQNVVVLPSISVHKPKQPSLKPKIVFLPTPKAVKPVSFKTRKASISIVNVQNKIFDHLEPRIFSLCEDRYSDTDKLFANRTDLMNKIDERNKRVSEAFTFTSPHRFSQLSRFDELK